MSEIRTQVQFVDIDEDMAGQRIDNFLRNQLKHPEKHDLPVTVRSVKSANKNVSRLSTTKSWWFSSYPASYHWRESRRERAKHETQQGFRIGTVHHLWRWSSTLIPK